MMYGYGLGASMGGGIFMILLIGLVVWLIVSALRPERTAHTTQTGSTSRAIEVLADRYARGEIDGEEYRNRKAVIEGSI